MHNINPISLKIKEKVADTNTFFGFGRFERNTKKYEEDKSMVCGFISWLVAGCVNMYICGQDSKRKCKVECLKHYISFIIYQKFYYYYYYYWFFRFED